jgi:hypothetical protein
MLRIFDSSDEKVNLVREIILKNVNNISSIGRLARTFKERIQYYKNNSCINVDVWNTIIRYL